MMGGTAHQAHFWEDIRTPGLALPWCCRPPSSSTHLGGGGGAPPDAASDTASAPTTSQAKPFLTPFMNTELKYSKSDQR